MYCRLNKCEYIKEIDFAIFFLKKITRYEILDILFYYYIYLRDYTSLSYKIHSIKIKLYNVLLQLLFLFQ